MYKEKGKYVVMTPWFNVPSLKSNCENSKWFY